MPLGPSRKQIHCIYRKCGEIIHIHDVGEERFLTVCNYVCRTCDMTVPDIRLTFQSSPGGERIHEKQGQHSPGQSQSFPHERRALHNYGARSVYLFVWQCWKELAELRRKAMHFVLKKGIITFSDGKLQIPVLRCQCFIQQGKTIIYIFKISKLIRFISF